MESSIGHARRADGTAVDHGSLLAARQPARHRQHDAARLGQQRRQRQQARQLDAVEVALHLRNAAARRVRLHNTDTQTHSQL